MNINTETGEITLAEPTFTSLYTHNRQRSRLFATVNNEETMTQQDDAVDCDINVIMKRYSKTGMLPQVQQTPLYGDFSTGEDYRDYMNKINAANQAFADIPANIRDRFNNDPAKFIDFIHDKENLPELRKMGLANPEPTPPAPPEPIKVIVTNPEPPK